MKKSKLKKALATAGVLSVALLSGVGLASCDDGGEPDVSDVDLTITKSEAILSVSSYKDKSNYRDAGKSEIDNIINDAKTKINASTSKESIDLIVSEAKSKLDAVKTAAELDKENVHTHVYGNWSVTTKPTETTTGLISRTCSTDNNVETAELPVLTDTSYTVTITKEATCEEKGTKTYTYTKDGQDLVVATVDIAALGHSYGSWVETTKPTVDAEGLLTKKCSTCGNEVTHKLPMLNETDYTYEVTKEATYKDKGSATYSIEFEGKIYIYIVELETNGVANYTLAEFNALESIDDRITTIYLDFGNQSLANGNVVIGSDTLKDVHEFFNNLLGDTLNGKALTVSDLAYGVVLDSGRKITGVDEQNQYHTITQKHGANIIIKGGSLTGGADVAKPDTIDGVNALTLLLPSACSVTFEDFEASKYLRIYTDTYSENRLESITFKDSTFNGIIQQCARVYTKELVFDGCTFNNYINSASANNSNPIWIQTPYSLNFTMNNCKVNSSRPIKIVEGTVTGNYTFTNNTFDMSNENSGDEKDEYKHIGITFESSTSLGNVLISGNTLLGGTSLISFRRSGSEGTYTTSIVMKDGATFTVINNTICDGAVLCSPWKKTEAWMPDFVITTAQTEE